MHKLLIITMPIIGTMSVLIILQQKDSLFESVSTCLEGVYSTSFCIFNLRPIRLKTRYSERILFVSKGVSVTGFSNSRWEHNDYHENTPELGYNVMSVVITECYNVMVYREELIGTTEYLTL